MYNMKCHGIAWPLQIGYGYEFVVRLDKVLPEVGVRLKSLNITFQYLVDQYILLLL